MTSLSVIVITKNESSNIRECLESVVWADEIIVLDSGSDDDTVAIARQFTSSVFISEDWQGFGIQKQRALAYASGDWVLSLDADERVPAELKSEIIAKISIDNKQSAYMIPRRSFYCGKVIMHSGWWPDYVLRLFPRNQANFSIDPVHERVLFSGDVKVLSQPMTHHSYESLDDVLSKMNHYSSAWAKSQPDTKQASPVSAVLRGVWAFIRSYLLRRGFLDGAEGFALAVSNGQGTYYKYMKLFFLQRKANK